MRRQVPMIIMVIVLCSALFVMLAPAYAGADHPGYYFSGTSSYNCFPGGQGAQGSIVNAMVERSNIPSDGLTWRIYAIINGEETLQTSGPGNPGTGFVGNYSFNFTDTAFPITAVYRIDTIMDNEIIYQSTLSVLCTSEVYNVDTGFPLNQDVNIPLSGADANCPIPMPAESPLGMIVETMTALWGPNAEDVTNIVLPAGSHWHVMTTQNGFDRLWIACFANPVWVDAENVNLP
ncbi:MAG: hypothetical protein U0670_03865 [Anaerolineae bacterium]